MMMMKLLLRTTMMMLKLWVEMSVLWRCQASPYMLDIAPLRSSIPELPAQTRAGLEQEHGLSPSIAARLVAWPELLAFFRCHPLSVMLNTPNICLGGVLRSGQKALRR